MAATKGQDKGELFFPPLLLATPAFFFLAACCRHASPLSGSPPFFLRGSNSFSWCRVIVLCPAAHESGHEKERVGPARARPPPRFEFDEKKRRGTVDGKVVFNALASFFFFCPRRRACPIFFLAADIALQQSFSIPHPKRGRKKNKSGRLFFVVGYFRFLMGLSSPLASSSTAPASTASGFYGLIARLSCSLFNPKLTPSPPLNDPLKHFLSQFLQETRNVASEG